MQSDIMENIQNSLQLLYDALERITPENQLEKDPFTIYRSRVAQITDFIDKLTRDAVEEENKIKNEIEKIQKQIEQWCSLLAIQVPVHEKVPNIYLMRAQTVFELRRVENLKNSIKSEIDVLKKEICELCDRIGESIPQMDEEVSAKALTELRGRYALLSECARNKEMRRKCLYESIKNSSLVLCREIEIRYDEKIGELEKMSEDMIVEINRRRDECEKVREEVRRKEEYLEVPNREFLSDLSDERIREMAEYCEYLRVEIEKRLEGIFEKAKNELEEMSRIFGIVYEPMERTEENLQKMKAMIKELRPKREEYEEILESIEKRKDLLVRMTEFEKIASDPKRLFKSSFQLNQEERFRNTAYPNLLKLEERIFELILRYEESYGEFVYEGVPYRAALQLEISNRIINRTVFISRCDSPYRKKK